MFGISSRANQIWQTGGSPGEPKSSGDADELRTITGVMPFDESQITAGSDVIQDFLLVRR